MANDSKIPITRTEVSAEKAEAIRQAVRTATGVPTVEDQSRLATPEDADAFHAFLMDPAVHAPIYLLPRPLTPETVRTFIRDHQAEQEKGEGLLALNFCADGTITGYSDLTIWPDWAAGEMSGAVHPAQQSQGRGLKGAAIAFGWMFDTLGIDLLCETAALDNIRTAKLLDHLGFTRRGEVLSTRPDGSTRPSLVWEITKDSWAKRTSR
ncbi:GNAT family N-acetyltransferase [Kordiimonas marina]|uniref:GNAT family N-acetyltransferase n=1 Tax=Kordiimonas marina TaxID=2872312 RepID=UPI001FF40165|nr:GNAT family N-acetyltransferase [Kordiimonas marina]MCJ9427931.1 GNAT family N-acetyltransferase [Kordiimonas marina]